MNKKIFLLSQCLILVLAFFLFGCGSNDQDYEGNGEIYVDKNWDLFTAEHVATKPVEIDFWSANSAVDNAGSNMGILVEEFNAYQKATFPDSYIKVNAAFQGGYGVSNTKIQAGLVGGTNPEIAMVGVSSFALYVDNVIDMREIFTYSQIEDIFPAFLQFAMYKNVFIGYPYFSSTNLFLVNRTLAEATGMAVPSVDEILADPENSIWTWEYMKQLTQAMRKTEGDVEYYGLASSGPALYEAFFTQGMAPYNETATQINFNNEAGLKTLEYWRSLVVDECMVNPVLDPNHGTKIQGQFSQGQVGLLWGTSTVIASIYENVYTNRIAQGKDPLFEMDVLPFPKVTDYYSNQSGGGIVIFNNKSDAKTQAAVEFLRWLQAPEQVAYYSTTTGYMPSTVSSTQTQAWADYTAVTPLKDRVLDMMALQPDDDISVPIGRAKALADEDFGKYAKGIYYDDCTRDISAILTETAERVQYILDTNSW